MLIVLVIVSLTGSQTDCGVFSVFEKESTCPFIYLTPEKPKTVSLTRLFYMMPDHCVAFNLVGLNDSAV